ncbi:hypothetical protein QLH52_20235 [Methylomonas sp. OY6]|jgi:hypothetical protein|uniref:Uncharacterized protein n=4 Tax=Methylococcaceae TaxID=403 RepID=A0AA91DBK8_9GAMM|nr:hypothetical protein [Methylomonas sp. OY6]MDX8129637.1 hypothetical protein [Methylomonas sp. OY6]OAI25124.1 hypothetical protein A1356_14160 [Methylomonas koyamae]
MNRPIKPGTERSRSMFFSEEEMTAAVSDLRAMGSAAIKILAESVERGEIKRKSLSQAVKKLELEGFVRVFSEGPFSEEFIIRPTLIGEDAVAEVLGYD